MTCMYMYVFMSVCVFIQAQMYLPSHTSTIKKYCLGRFTIISLSVKI